MDLGRVDFQKLPELVGSIDSETLTVADLPQLMRLHREFESSAWAAERDGIEGVGYARDRLEAAMRKAFWELNLTALTRMTLGDGKREYGTPELYDALCHRWIEGEISKILRERKRPLTFPSAPLALPDQLKPRWQDAPGAVDYARAASPFAKMLTAAKESPPRGIHREAESFDNVARELLTGGGRDAARGLLRFTWDSWCGTGAFEFYGTQMTLVFMSLLRDRRLEEALGVSFRVPNAPQWLREPGRPFDRWRIDLLKYCGFDWEPVMLHAGHHEFLAANGSEIAARHELAMFKAQPDPDSRRIELEELLAFLSPGSPDTWSEDDPRRTLPTELQTGILKALTDAVEGDVPFNELDRWLKHLEQLRRLETKETLRALLKHPSPTYAEKAARILRGMGDDIPTIRPVLPVRFRILLNGKSWPAEEIAYHFTGHPPGSVNLGTGSVKPDAEGFATIPRDDFLDPAKRGPRLVFFHFPSLGSSSMWSEKQYDDPWLSTEVATPQAFDQVTNVEFTACRLPIEINYFSAPVLVRRAPTRFKLSKAGEKDPNTWGFNLHFEDRMEAPMGFTLGTIQPGRYQLAILAPGSAQIVTPPFEVTPGMAPVRVSLEKGCHLYASIIAPENARGSGEIRLIRDGEDVSEKFGTDYYMGRHRPLFAGVPKGRYQLRVLSTEDYMKKHNIKDWPVPNAMWQKDLREGIDCEGATLDFEIVDSTPALLDLGRIEIVPVPATKTKVGTRRLITPGPPPP
ncbi:MAG: hypothetical protein QOE70_5914 [Chthoniobacter sp.]|nr:hypothetical protein [Chthoniobacter sp.]